MTFGCGGKTIEIRLQPPESLFHANTWGVIKVADGGGSVVGVGTCKLCGEKAGHGRLGPESEQCPEDLEGGARVPRRASADFSLHRWQSSSIQQQIDPVPEIHGSWVVNEVCAAGRFAGRSQGDFGCQMGSSGVFDVGDGDEVLPVADLAKPAMAGGEEEFRDEVIIARAPDEVWSECAGEQPVGSGRCQDSLFGERFGVGVMAQPALRIGGGFVGVQVIRSVKDHAGGAGVDQARDGVRAAGIEDIECPLMINAEVEAAGAPDAGDGGGVEDRIDAIAGALHKTGIADVPLYQLGAGGSDSRIVTAAENSHSVPLHPQEFHDVQSEEASAARHEHLEGFEGRRHFEFRK